MAGMVGFAALIAGWGLAADVATDLRQVAQVAQAMAAIIAGGIAILGVPLALRQVANLQREMRRYETETRRRLDAETNLTITARYSLTRPAHDAPHDSLHGRHAHFMRDGDLSARPSPLAEPGKRVLRLDLTLENVGEGTVDLLACLVAARELERQGDEVSEGGRDVQWDDLTAHYWDGDEHCLSPGLSTTKHIIYAQDALARIKAHSRKTLARIDQVREREADEEIYLLYRAFVAARRSSRSTEDVQAWEALQRAMLNVNAPAFRVVAEERDPLGYVASPDGWRLFLLHYEALADRKLSALRSAADRAELATADAEERSRLAIQHAEELRTYCTKTLLPRWKAFRAEHARMTAGADGFLGLLHDRDVRRRQREAERRFPWESQEVWTEYFYVSVHEDE